MQSFSCCLSYRAGVCWRSQNFLKTLGFRPLGGDVARRLETCLSPRVILQNLVVLDQRVWAYGDWPGVCVGLFAPWITASFLTLNTDICKSVRLVALPVVGRRCERQQLCGPRFETQAVFTFDLVTLTFDLSTSKWVTGHPCHGLPSCQFSVAVPFRSRLRVRYGTDRQTDRQTTAINA